MDLILNGLYSGTGVTHPDPWLSAQGLFLVEPVYPAHPSGINRSTSSL